VPAAQLDRPVLNHQVRQPFTDSDDLDVGLRIARRARSAQHEVADA